MEKLSELSTEELIKMRDGHFYRWKEFIRLANIEASRLDEINAEITHRVITNTLNTDGKCK